MCHYFNDLTIEEGATGGRYGVCIKDLINRLRAHCARWSEVLYMPATIGWRCGDGDGIGSRIGSQQVGRSQSQRLNKLVVLDSGSPTLRLQGL